MQRLHLRAQQDLGLGIIPQALDGYLVGAERGAVDEVELPRVFREEIRRVDSGVAAAAADDRDGLVLVALAVTEFAVVDAAARVAAFLRQRQAPPVHASIVSACVSAAAAMASASLFVLPVWEK